MCQLNFYLLILFAAFVKSMALYSDCGSEIGTILSVNVSECTDSDSRCILRRGGNTTFKLTFTLKENVKSVKAAGYAVIDDVPIQFSLPNADGCVDSGLSCPLQSGGTYTYQTSVRVNPIFPLVMLDVKWELTNESGVNIICALIPSKVCGRVICLY